jgi:conjugative transposon TraM protein
MKHVKMKKMLLMLPVLVIPFLTMAFWALGGGGNKKQIAGKEKGLNLQLPDAHLKDERGMDKLGFYDKADKDSIKMAEWMRSDPYFKKDSFMSFAEPSALEELTESTASKYNQRLNVSPYETGRNNPEEKVLQKLKLLQNQLSMPAVAEEENNSYKHHADDDALINSVSRLEQLMKTNNPNEDPEMDQLDGTLEKILDVQHPDRVKNRLREQSLQHAAVAYAVSKSSGADTLVKGFYGVSGEKEISEHVSIEAVVQENQTLVNGSVVKFRLANGIYINGKLVPKGSFVFGLAALDGERLNIEINSIRSATNLFNVKLSVYDMDGLPGIYIPGAINRDAAKQSADNSLSLLELSAADPSIKTKAATAGIGAMKNLLSKKVRMVKVLVKAGYKVLLKDKNNEQ